MDAGDIVLGTETGQFVLERLFALGGLLLGVFQGFLRLILRVVRLGISTHSYAEAARAKALDPSYIALGPIFPTTLKSMNFAPQGIETLRIWRQLFACPLVAIGGITEARVPETLTAGADAVAIITDIVNAPDLTAKVRAILAIE